jgi:hypothetical protein
VLKRVDVTGLFALTWLPFVAHQRSLRALKNFTRQYAHTGMNRLKTFYSRLIALLVSFLTLRNPVLATRILFRHIMGYSLNLARPETYNEKIQWLKLYNETPLMIKCGDKYGVRGYVEEKGCGELLNELYGLYASADEIDFSVLPQKFVLKITNACGYNIICDKGDLDEGQVCNQLKKWQKQPFGLETAEPHYSKMRSRIICERFLVDAATGSLNDYRVHCLNGEPVYMAATRQKQAGQPYRTLRFDFKKDLIALPGETDVGQGLMDMLPSDEMLAELHAYAKILSAGIKLVRIDFYIVDGKVYLGEMTFTPGAGLLKNVDFVFQNPKYSHYLQGLC